MSLQNMPLRSIPLARCRMEMSANCADWRSTRHAESSGGHARNPEAAASEFELTHTLSLASTRVWRRRQRRHRVLLFRRQRRAPEPTGTAPAAVSTPGPHPRRAGTCRPAPAGRSKRRDGVAPGGARAAASAVAARTHERRPLCAAATERRRPPWRTSPVISAHPPTLHN